MGRSIVSGRVTLWASFGALCFIGALPVGLMLLDSVLVDGAFGLVRYRELVIHAAAWRLMGKTLVVASLTSLFATAIGVPLGFLLGKTDLALRVPLAAMFTFPLLLPPYVLAIAWFRILGRTGLLAQATGPSSGELFSSLLFGLPGCVWVLSLSFVSIPMLLTMVRLKAIPQRLEEAGRLAGAWPLIVRRISLPLAGSGILFGSILVFVLAAGEFTVPGFLRYDTFPVLSFTRFAASYDFASATAAAAPMAILVIAIVGAEARYLKGDRLPSGIGGDNRLLVSLGRFRWPAFIVVLLVACGTILAPIAALLAVARPSGITAAFADSRGSLFRGVLYSLVAAGLLTLLGLVLSWLVERRALPVWRATEFTSLLLFALPGTVLAIGLIHIWNRPAFHLIYSSPVMLILAYVSQYAGLTTRLIGASIAAIPTSMEEAGRMAGAGWYRRMAGIVAPLAHRGILLGFAASFLFCQRDVALPSMLAPPGLETLPARTMTLMANGAPEMVSAMCALMVAGTLATSALAAILIRWAKRA